MTQLAPTVCVRAPIQRHVLQTCRCRTTLLFSSASISSSSSSTEEGITFEGIVQGGKMRLDTWLASQLPSHISRARAQSTIRSGLAHVNGQPVDKVSYCVRNGDQVKCAVIALAPLKAEPENIMLDIIFEDDSILVVNKPANMVTHPAPGNWNGTLVNALVHHCELPVARQLTHESCSDESEENEFGVEDEGLDPTPKFYSNSYKGGSLSVRPGIVHRLDKGTSGLLVIAKNEHAHDHLSKQFKDRTVKRSYLSMLCGTPSCKQGRIDVAIGRDIHNRIRMAAFPNSSTSKNARKAVSRYEVVEVLANGGASLVEWKLETGRTHQIRVHAQFLGHPLLGDDLYGCTKGAALSFLIPKIPASKHGKARKLINQLQRPALHATSLGFVHPHSLEKMMFRCPLPNDFEEVWIQLRSLSDTGL